LNPTLPTVAREVPQGKKANSDEDPAAFATTRTSIIPGISSIELMPASLSRGNGIILEGADGSCDATIPGNGCE
jgi:hypothetical protein